MLNIKQHNLNQTYIISYLYCHYPVPLVLSCHICVYDDRQNGFDIVHCRLVTVIRNMIFFLVYSGGKTTHIAALMKNKVFYNCLCECVY